MADTELIQTKELNPVALFSGGGLDPVLDEITQVAKAIIPDLETTKGRKEIASMANKVAKSKTFLDALGKDLVSEQKSAIKKVDAERKHMRDYLDDLKVEVRKPLTDWEDTEKARVDGLQTQLAVLRGYGQGDDMGILCITSTELSQLLDKAGSIVIDDSWDEFAAEAAQVKDKTITELKQRFEQRKIYEAEQTELSRLRLEKDERDRKDHEERIAREAADKARLEAEAEKQVAIDAKNKAESDAQEAGERAEREKQEAVENERRAAEQREQQRIESEQKAKEQEERERQSRLSDREHRARINTAAKQSLVDNRISEECARAVIILIANGVVPNITINY